MTNARLSLDAFKQKAKNVNTNEVLEKIKGGDASECHGAVSANHKVYLTLKEAWDSIWE